MGKAKTIDIELNEFHMNMIKDGKKIVFIGKTNTGKSTLVLDYLYYHRSIPIVSVISPTDIYNRTFSPHIPSMLIHDKYTPELIESIVKRQQTITQRVNEDPEYKEIDPRAICILDDCLAESKEWINDQNIRWIFYNGRHVKLTFILTMQFSIGIPPALRSNLQYIFLCRDNRIIEQKKLYANYGSIFKSFDLFKQVHDKYTENYGCLVINLESTSINLNECVYWYKAKTEDKMDWNTFKLCPSYLWTNNEEIKNININHEEEIVEDDTKNVKYNIKKSKLKYKEEGEFI